MLRPGQAFSNVCFTSEFLNREFDEMKDRKPVAARVAFATQPKRQASVFCGSNQDKTDADLERLIAANRRELSRLKQENAVLTRQLANRKYLLSLKAESGRMAMNR